MSSDTSYKFTTGRAGNHYLPLTIDRGNCRGCQDRIKVSYEFIDNYLPGVRILGGPPSNKTIPERGSLSVLPVFIPENEIGIDLLIEYNGYSTIGDEVGRVKVVFRANCNDRIQPIVKELELTIEVIDINTRANRPELLVTNVVNRTFPGNEQHLSLPFILNNTVLGPNSQVLEFEFFRTDNIIGDISLIETRPADLIPLGLEIIGTPVVDTNKVTLTIGYLPNANIDREVVNQLDFVFSASLRQVNDQGLVNVLPTFTQLPQPLQVEYVDEGQSLIDRGFLIKRTNYITPFEFDRNPNRIQKRTIKFEFTRYTSCLTEPITVQMVLPQTPNPILYGIDFETIPPNLDTIPYDVTGSELEVTIIFKDEITIDQNTGQSRRLPTTQELNRITPTGRVGDDWRYEFEFLFESLCDVNVTNVPYNREVGPIEFQIIDTRPPSCQDMVQVNYVRVINNPNYCPPGW